MTAPALTQPELLSMWEKGEGRRPSGRALALLAGAAPDATAEEAAAMPVGRRDASLLDLRVALFGRAFVAVTNCPACGEEIEIAFEADEVRRDAAVCERFEWRDGDYAIDVRIPTTSDLAAIDLAGDIDTARDELFARCVGRASHAGEAVTAATLPAGVADAIVEAMAKADPQADVRLDLACPTCEERWIDSFDICTFLWSELAALARHLLFDVHQLARAYGWSEREILALAPARRNAYLEMLR